MKEIAVRALDVSWSEGVRAIEVATFLPEAPKDIIAETRIVYQGKVIIAEQLLRAPSGIAPSLYGAWGLYLVSGPDRAVKFLTGVKSMTCLLRHLATESEEVPTLIGSDIRVRVTLPASMTDPHDPPPAFLIHIEGE